MQTFSLTLQFQIFLNNSDHSHDARAVTSARTWGGTHLQLLFMQTRGGGGLYGSRRPVLLFPSNSGLANLIDSQA